MPHKLSALATKHTLRRLPAGPYAGTIHTTAVESTDELYVTVDIEGPTVLRGPCKGWQPRGELLPVIGDTAAVLVLDDNSLWIVGWWPQ